MKDTDVEKGKDDSDEEEEEEILDIEDEEERRRKEEEEAKKQKKRQETWELIHVFIAFIIIIGMAVGIVHLNSIRRFVITEKAPTRAFSWLKAATTAFIFKTLLRHYAKRALTPLSP